jgi:hypothetical protein
LVLSGPLWNEAKILATKGRKHRFGSDVGFGPTWLHP